MIIWFSLWVICGIASAIIASQKGHPGCAWFLVGCALGPIALLIALIMPRDTKPEEPPHQEQPKPDVPISDTKKCPYCAEEIKREAILCRFCNQRLDKPFELGCEALRAGDYSTASQHFTDAIEEGGNVGEAHYCRAIAYNKNGQRDQALNDLKKAASLGHAKAKAKLESEGIAY